MGISCGKSKLACKVGDLDLTGSTNGLKEDRVYRIRNIKSRMVLHVPELLNGVKMVCKQLRSDQEGEKYQMFKAIESEIDGKSCRVLSLASRTSPTDIDFVLEAQSDLGDLILKEKNNGPRQLWRAVPTPFGSDTFLIENNSGNTSSYLKCSGNGSDVTICHVDLEDPILGEMVWKLEECICRSS